MNLHYLIIYIIETLLRVFPFPCQTGLIKIGDPDINSPVILTCNYHLTVEGVKRAIKGIDVYLLVANSKGINVWCSATGGRFTNHDVISVLKTSGIEEVVGHRNVILPQLAATGVEAKIIKEKTGWEVIWGPVYAKDLPLFLKDHFIKTPKMREVEFPWKQRIEMAVAWAFPISAVLAIIMIIFRSEAILPVVFLVWIISFLIFISFPVYSRFLKTEGKKIGFIFFDFGRGSLQLIIWTILMVALAIYVVLSGNFSWRFILFWGFISFIVVLILSIDLMGSTPVYKGGFQDDRLLKVILDKDKCKGVGFCEEICPRNCFEVDRKRHIATMPRADQCVQCGACIVQCPLNALYFKSPNGEIIPPETIRKFKLNLMGKRFVKVEEK
ncbi:copper oxidase [Methanococcoides methylutens]|uniref:Copper oxidase n=1 Tax=Methanococcoides methylutens TaxID=2226 RepID=A0A099T6I7_METMT|nr:HgcAB-like fusion protein [Methanococcoides methylutens]KGK99763.1 copper oxidase [Methanococcoides methylutens]